MKHILFFLILFLPFCSETIAQDKAIIVKDTLMYNAKKFYVDQRIRLWYGSAADKSFAYVTFGSDMMGWSPCPAQWSKYEAIVSEVKITKGKAWVKAKIVEYPTKLLIDLEGAIDNNELK